MSDKIEVNEKEVEDLEDLDYIEELMKPVVGDSGTQIPTSQNPRRFELGYEDVESEESGFDFKRGLEPEETPLLDVWVESDLQRAHGLEEEDVRKADKARLQRLEVRSTLKKYGLQIGAKFWHRKRFVWCRIEDIDYDNRYILLTRLGKKGWIGPFSNSIEYVLKDSDFPVLIPGKCPQI